MIFCVEDDNSIRDLMLYTLQASGFQAEGFGDVHSMLEALETKTPELIMLDIMLPDEDGITALNRLRANHITTDIPVIMATAKGTEYDKVIGLDSGADDYMVKPFGMMEMVSRVKAVLRRSVVQEEQVLCVGDIELNLSKHTVTAAAKRVQLTLKEFELLNLLMEKPGMVFTRAQLLSLVWGIDYEGETRTIDVHIGTLRTKLGDCGKYIETVRGVGYRMEVRA